MGLVGAAEAATTAHGGEVVRWGSAVDWAVALTAGISALILILIVVSLVVFRGRQTEGSALWVHLLSLGVLPLVLLAIGQFATLEYATEVQFCGSCHLTMKPYIDDLHNPKSASLASLHAQNRMGPGTECYSCHANYGVHGTIEAKLTGLRHVYKYNTGTYHLPLEDAGAVREHAVPEVPQRRQALHGAGHSPGERPGLRRAAEQQDGVRLLPRSRP